MKLSELEYTMPTEDVKYIFENANIKPENRTQTIRLLNVNWEKFKLLSRKISNLVDKV